MTVRRFYAPPSQFSAGTVTLDEDETRHLRDVLRLKIGDTAHVFDGEGKEFACTVESIEKRRSILNLNEQVMPSSPESPLDLTIASVLLKGDKLDLVVQKPWSLA